MKKAFCGFLVFAFLLPAWALAEMEYYTLGELYSQIMAQYPEGWKESIPTKWRTVEIDTPVIVPNAEAMPILALEAIADPPEESLLPGTGWSVEAKSAVRCSRDSLEPAPSTKNSTLTSTHLYAPLDGSLILDGYGGKTILELLEEGNSLVSAVSGGKYAWDWAHAYDVMYNTRTNKKGESWNVYLNFLAYPTFHGVPFLYGIAHYLTYEVHQNLLYADLLYGVSPWGGISFVYSPIREEVVEADVPLAGFEKVQETLRREIEAGHIRRILEMRLGLMTLDRSSDPADPVSLTRPYWHVEVWWCNKGVSEMRKDDPKYPTNSRGKMECVRIAIDAQTGEIISMSGDCLPDQKKVKGIEVFSGYISWAEVNEN